MEKVYVLLKNRTARFMKPYPRDKIREMLKYKEPGSEYTWEVKSGAWDGYVYLLSGDMVGSGTFIALREKLEKELELEFLVCDKRTFPDLKPASAVPLGKDVRPYQQECLEKMLLASNSGGLILNATGTGKTFIAGRYFKCLVGSGVFLVDELQLLDQSRRELASVLQEEIGIIGNSLFAPQRITVATVQTVHRHKRDPNFLPWIKSLQAIIIDEIHLALNRRNFETIAVVKPPVVFGLTATLQLKKKDVYLRAYDLTGPSIFSYPLKQGESDGYLSKGIAISARLAFEAPEHEGGWRPGGNMFEYLRRHREAYTALIVEGKKRNKFICDLVREAYERGKYTILIAERLKHLKDLSEKLADVPHEVVSGDKEVAQRVSSTKKFEEGETRCILASKVFTKGINIKRVDCIIDASAMKSANSTQQKYGRGVRLCEEKTGLIYIDIADVENRFEKASQERLKALKRLGIPVFKIESDIGAKEIFRLAEKQLVERIKGTEK